MAFVMERLGEREELSAALVGDLTRQVVEAIDDATPEYLELITDGDTDESDDDGDTR